MFPAIFLDRDGVIIENRANYVRSWNDVSIYPAALDALAQINGLAVKVIIVTNQSVVGRGLISLREAHMINDRLVDVIRQSDGRIDRVFMCPHAPNVGCGCRKPKPGLLRRAAWELSLDLQRSVMIGDALTDLMAARAAGVRQLALVRTGRGTMQARMPQAQTVQPFRTYDSVAEALRQELQRMRQHFLI